MTIGELGGIVLCGGGSVRMGREKASLPFGPGRTLLGCVVDALVETMPAANVLVVAARGQALPPVADGVRVMHEEHQGAGPLVALAAGLRAAPAGVESFFVCGCDAPLLAPAFVRRLWELTPAEADAAALIAEGRCHPLAAIYRRRCVAALEAAIVAGGRSLHRALASPALRTHWVAAEQLRSVDPELLALVNCNTPAEYDVALRRA